MSEDGIAQDSIGHFTHHGRLQYGHDLASFDAQDRATQNLPVTGIYHGFHEAARLVRFQGASYIIHGHRGYFDIAIMSTGLGFSQSYPARRGSIKTVEGTRRTASM